MGGGQFHERGASSKTVEVITPVSALDAGNELFQSQALNVRIPLGKTAETICYSAAPFAFANRWLRTVVWIERSPNLTAWIRASQRPAGEVSRTS